MSENSLNQIRIRTMVSPQVPTAAQLWRRISLWIFLVICFSVPFLLFSDRTVYAFDGFVREENNYVIVETKDSGKFVGIKSGETEEVLGDLKISNNDKEYNKFKSDSVINEKIKKIIYTFRGIPYAKPPVGTLRWKDPEPIQVTFGPIDTTKYKSICAQWDQTSESVIGDVDCLYLNIFTPRLHFTITRTPGDGSPISPFDDDPRYAIRLLPVLLWIHPGSFLTGSGNIESPESVIQSGDVILVTFNYRLGLFGFLTNGNELEGNYGLLDQLSVLKWINKNIHRFGGDPNRVTIAGDTLPLLLVPSAETYYSGIIYLASMQNPFSPGFSSGHNENKYFYKLLREVECDSNPDPIQDCLNLKTAEELVALQQKFIQFGIYPRHTKLKLPSPSENFTLLPTDIEKYFNSEEFKSSKTPILVGINSFQGEEMASLFSENHPNLRNDNIKKALHHTLKIILPDILQATEVCDEIWKFYFGDLDKIAENYEYEFRDQLAKLFGDITVSVPHQKLLETLSSRNHISYSFIFESKVAESPLIFNQNFTSNDDEVVADILRKLWISFTAYKTPKNAVGKEKNWTRFFRLGMNAENKTNNYMINNEGGKMRPGFKEQESAFWFETLPKLYNSVSYKYETNSEAGEDWSLMFWILIGLGVLSVFILAVVILYFCLL